MNSRPQEANEAAGQAILARVREALRLPAPPPHIRSQTPTAGPAAHPGLAILPAEASRPWLPDGGDSPAESMGIFTENLATLRAECVRVADMNAAAAWLAGQARQRGWQRVAFHDDPLIASVVEVLPCDRYRVDSPGESCDKTMLEACDAGVSGCECLIAQTGSILVSSNQGGRGLSILPHVHVVLARVDQIVPMLSDALAVVRQQHQGRLPSMLSFITGPSRTGDIERILVLGAHGPKELLVILVG
jgi:L-lactate dehydrogenase complex protein LldG